MKICHMFEQETSDNVRCFFVTKTIVLISIRTSQIGVIALRSSSWFIWSNLERIKACINVIPQKCWYDKIDILEGKNYLCNVWCSQAIIDQYNRKGHKYFLSLSHQFIIMNIIVFKNYPRLNGHYIDCVHLDICHEDDHCKHFFKHRFKFQAFFPLVFNESTAYLHGQRR